ncbi:MAG: hypothetical protein ACTSYF_07860 [Promethearchaeota archaeon]
MSPAGKTKYETFKHDAAPFFFYIDVLPLDLSQYEIPHHVKLLEKVKYNPIMPLPLRVDRVFNGESSIIIRPRDPISFSIGEQIALIKPTPFIQAGIEKLLIFTEVRASGEFAISLTADNAQKWWNFTNYLHGRSRTLEEDFAAFLRGYLFIMVKAKINNEDLISAATQYCELIKDICNQRIQENYILVEKRDKEEIVKLYKMKEGKVYKKFKSEKKDLLYPNFAEMEIFDLKELGFSQVKEQDANILKKNSKIMNYIPLLIYDDLLECMLQNLENLKDFEGNILDPSFLLEQNIIIISNVDDFPSDQYTWEKIFDEIDLDSILKSIDPTFPNRL